MNLTYLKKSKNVGETEVTGNSIVSKYLFKKNKKQNKNKKHLQNK